MYMCVCIILLYTSNEHNFVNKLYPNKIKKKRNLLKFTKQPSFIAKVKSVGTLAFTLFGFLYVFVLVPDLSHEFCFLCAF